MKKLVMILCLIFGISSFGIAQSPEHQGAEKRSSKKVEPHKQMYHFEKQKKDKAIEHNGTAYYRNQHQKSKYVVDGNGFASSKTYKEGKKRKGRKTRSKTFGTYTMK